MTGTPSNIVQPEAGIPFVVPVLLAGGAGKRLWPLSTMEQPKQFQPLLPQGRTPFQAAIDRITPWRQGDAMIVVTAMPFLGHAQFQAAAMGVTLRHCLVEPVSRNTTAAIASAVAYADTVLEWHDPLLLMLPCDQVLETGPAWQDAMRHACAAAEQGRIVTFGIAPDRPHTGFGYIEPVDGEAFSPVRRFHEKPDAATAAHYIERGFLWNSGMFLARASVWRDALHTHAATLAEGAREALRQGTPIPGGQVLALAAYDTLPDIAIDRSVMEPGAARLSVCRLAAGWNDLGHWQGVWQEGMRDGDGNCALFEHERVTLEGAKGCLVASRQQPVICRDVDDLVVMVDEHAVLVTRRIPA